MTADSRIAHGKCFRLSSFCTGRDRQDCLSGISQRRYGTLALSANHLNCAAFSSVEKGLGMEIDNLCAFSFPDSVWAMSPTLFIYFLNIIQHRRRELTDLLVIDVFSCTRTFREEFPEDDTSGVNPPFIVYSMCGMHPNTERKWTV